MITRLSTFTPDSPSKLNVLGHNGDTLSVDSTQVGVLKETNKVSLSGFLESQDSMALETKVGLEVLGNLTDQPLERQLPDQQLSTLLILSNFTASQS